MNDNEDSGAPGAGEFHRRQAGRRRTIGSDTDEARKAGRRQNRPGLVALIRAIVQSKRPAVVQTPPDETDGS